MSKKISPVQIKLFYNSYFFLKLIKFHFLWGDNKCMAFPVLKPGELFQFLKKKKQPLQKGFICAGLIFSIFLTQLSQKNFHASTLLGRSQSTEGWLQRLGPSTKKLDKNRTSQLSTIFLVVVPGASARTLGTAFSTKRTLEPAVPPRYRLN